MTPPPHGQLPGEIGAVVALLRGVLGDSVVGAWVYGSAVVGGLKPDSDLDLLVAVNRPLTGAPRRALVDGLMRVSGRLALGGPARPLEVTVVDLDDVVPWRAPARMDLQYGEWLRGDFSSGRIAAPEVNPDLTILLATARAHSHPLIGPGAREVFEPIPVEDLHRAIRDSLPALVADLHGDERNVLLTLARMWMMLSTGEIVPKDAAAGWLLDRLPQQYCAVLVTARFGYRVGGGDDWSRRGDDVDAFVAHAIAVIESLVADGSPARKGPV
jgi:streptomycin 3"-adenylyltransferase